MGIRVAIVLGVKVFRDSLAAYLAREARSIHVIGAYPDVRAALGGFGFERPQAILIEAGDGIDGARLLRSRAPDAALVLMGIGRDPDTGQAHWADAGVAAWLTDDADLSTMVAVLERVARGEAMPWPELAAAPTGVSANRTGVSAGEDGRQALTARELEVVELLEEGLSNKDIGRRLRIRPATVKNHVHNILEKLKVRRRGEVAALVRRDGGIPGRP